MEEDYHYLPCFDSDHDMQSIDGVKTFFHEFYIESKKLWSLASPAISTSICQYSIAQITQLFAGHLGVLQLAAVSVENSVIAGLCYGALLGMGSALETLCGQAYGAKQLDMLGVYLQRSLIILNTAALVLMFLYLFATQILLFIGQPMDIAKWAGKFSIWMIPQLFAYAMNFPIQKFLQAQSKMMVMAVIAAIALVGHTLLSWLFMMKMDLGLVAGAVVLNGSWWFMVLAQFVYILCGTCGEAWSGFTFKAFENLWGFVRLSLASGVMICLEYWYFMALIISAGYVKDAKIAVDAVSICTSIVGWTFMLCIGFNAAISVRVSNELGAGHPRTAKFSVLVVSITSLLIGTILTIALFVARSRYPPLFTKSFEVQQAVYELTPLLGTTIMLNGLQPTLSGVAIGAGWQIYVAYINIVSYYAFGIPLGLIFSFCLDMGVKGMWTGMLLGTTLQTSILILMISKTNWKKEASVAEERVKEWRGSK
ncbi:protein DETOXIFICATION 29-like [Solanum lycopersicum]|uniref:protein DETOXIFICATION 29-like n=1 Tax=Solanum lycopersicum TaxID=4081 RepID=UPI00374923BC